MANRTNKRKVPQYIFVKIKIKAVINKININLTIFTEKEQI